MSINRVSWRRAAQVLTCLCVVASVLTGSPSPARAAKAPPWRWAKVTQPLQIPTGSNSSANLVCPAGYVPISGGWSTSESSVYRMLEYPNPGGNSYTITLGNSSGTTTVDLVAWCAHADDVGPITSVFQEFAANASRRAGGVVTCPAGQGVISGGADWATTGFRRIDYSGPTVLGDGWFASGVSAVDGDTFGIEVRCVPNAVLTGQQVRTSVTSIGPQAGGVNGAPSCPGGTRPMTGGSWARAINSSAYDINDRGRTYRSTPASTPVQSWSAAAVNVANSTVTTVVLCVPATTPNVSWTQVPDQKSTAGSGHFSFSASDASGESLTASCKLDNAPISCAPNTAVPYTVNYNGTHKLDVEVKNTSERVATLTHSWTVDLSDPTAFAMTPTASAGLFGPFKTYFSEEVIGVDSTTFRVLPAGSSQPVAGTVAYTPTTSTSSGTIAPNATWRSVKPLVPGQRYTAHLSSTIHDDYGRTLQADPWQARAMTSVQNTSVALIEAWDLDAARVASGGRYIASRTAGSSATADVTVAAGQAVSVHAVRTPNGGHGALYVDGVKRATGSFYAASVRRARVFHVENLTPGAHEVQVRVLGTRPSASSGTWVGIDSVSVGTNVRQETGLRQAFRRVRATGASGGSYDVVSHATSGDSGAAPSYRVVFRGTSVALYASKTPDSGVALVYVDGVQKGSVNLYAANVKHNVKVFETTFADTVHTLRVVPQGSARGARSGVAVDHIEIG